MLLINQYLDYINKHTNWREWYPARDLEHDINWFTDNGLVIPEFGTDGELMSLGLFIATSYIELDLSKIMENVLGANDPNGEYLFCMFYVKTSGGLIPLDDLKYFWFQEYPNIKTLYYKRLSQDSRLMKVDIHGR
jgi:hypothetical protein